MTKEELKKHCLKQVEACEMWAKHNGEEPHGKVYEEHKLILELLEQEPCEDCISKKAVLDKINEICFSREQESVDFRVAQGSNGQRDLIINFIENLPSVQSKPKTEVLDKIRAEIEQIASRYTISRERAGMGQVEWEDRLIKEADVLQIIDKYKAEREVEE